MPMEQEPGLMLQDVVGQPVKAFMNPVIPVMDALRGIVGDEDVNGREG